MTLSERPVLVGFGVRFLFVLLFRVFFEGGKGKKSVPSRRRTGLGSV